MVKFNAAIACAVALFFTVITIPNASALHVYQGKGLSNIYLDSYDYKDDETRNYLDSICVLNKTELKCWGRDAAWKNTSNLPDTVKAFTDLRTAAMGNGGVCLLDGKRGIICWDNKNKIQAIPMENLQSLTYFRNTLCATGPSSTSCWYQDPHSGEYIQNKTLNNLKNPRNVSMQFFPFPVYQASCFIDDDGCKCWSLSSLEVFSLFPDLKNPKILTAAENHICGLGDNGVRCMGFEQIPDKPRWDYGQSDVPNDLKNPRLLATGTYRTCVVDDSGLRCWGKNSNISLPDGVDSKKIRSLSVGVSDVCVLEGDDSKCWGAVSDDARQSPPKSWNLDHVVQIDASSTHTCVLDTIEGVKCWQASTTETGYLSPPINLKNPRQIAVGNYYTCALDDTGVICWDKNGVYRMETPTKGGAVFMISAHGSNICALDAFGVTCKMLFDDPYAIEALATPFDLKDPHMLAAGAFNTCAIETSGLRCWGMNLYDLSNFPALINPKQISIGSAHVCVLDETGIKCGGKYNDSGQLDVPRDIINPSTIAAAWNYTCAIGENGVKCWGGVPFDLSGFNFKNPRLISAGAAGAFACVVDQNETKCVGDYIDPPGGTN